MQTSARNNSARALLQRLLQRQLASAGVVALTLGISVEQLSRYDRGDEVMPLSLADRLADLALRVGRTDPDARRRATALRNQVVATRAYEAGSTARVSNAPTLPWW